MAKKWYMESMLLISAIYQLMPTAKLPGSIIFGSQIKIHTGTEKYDVSLAKEFQDHLTKNHWKYGVINQGK